MHIDVHVSLLSSSVSVYVSTDRRRIVSEMALLFWNLDVQDHLSCRLTLSSFFSFLTEMKSPSKEMAQSGKCLVHKLSGLSLNPSTPIKSWEQW